MPIDRGDRFAFATDPAPLGRDRRFGLSLNLFVSVLPTPDDEGARRRTAGYAYVIADRETRELVAYHRHPGGSSPIDAPHLHLGARLLRPELARPLGRVHWPTERVTLTAVLSAAVDDLGIEPLREDWRERFAVADAVLAASLA